MAKTLGIDYGSKRIGLALSDEEGRVAFPFETIENSAKAVSKIRSICEREKIGRIVVGESLDESGNDNAIMPEVRVFSDKISKETGLPVDFEKEFFTSVEAHRSAFEEQGKEGRQKVDASAAALILQRYLDRQTNNK